LGTRRVDETGSPPLHRIAIERELRHHQQFPNGVEDRPVHLVFVVGEYAKADDLVGHPGELLFAIRMREPDEDDGTVADSANDVTGNADLTTRRAWNESSHGGRS